jgi:hypothetical protein
VNAQGVPPSRHTPLLRFALFVLCLAAGCAAGWAVAAWTGSAWGYVAIPLTLAIGWLFVADPTQCQCHEPPSR